MTGPPFDPSRIFAALDRAGVDYVTIGGVAALGHGSRRITLDVDIAPAPRPENYLRLATALADLGVIAEAVDSGFRDLDPADPVDLARATNLRIRTEAGGLDVLNAPAGAAPYADLRARSILIEVSGVPVRIVALDDLIAMKRAAGRPQDVRDIAELLGSDAAT